MIATTTSIRPGSIRPGSTGPVTIGSSSITRGGRPVRSSSVARPANGTVYAVRVPARFAATAPSAAVYRRRRALVAMFIAAFVASVALVVGAIAPSGSAAPVGAIGSTAGQRTYLVQPGDTLWALADRFRDQVGQAEYVALLVELNGGAGIEIGEVIALP